jgi:hypothetical protein
VRVPGVLAPLILAAVATVALVAAACGPGAASPSPVASPTVAPTPRAPDLPVATLPPVLEVPAGILASIQDEVSRLASVPVDQLTLVRAQQITWPDGSLGCPAPGEMYTQSLVSGYWIVFRANNETFDFRVTEDGHYHRCDLPGLPGPPGADPN